jgi:hypothetical protein
MRAADIMTINIFTIDSLATVADAIARSKNALRSSRRSSSKTVYPLLKKDQLRSIPRNGRYETR